MTGRHVFTMLFLTVATAFIHPLLSLCMAIGFIAVTILWYIAEGRRMDAAALDDVRKHKKRLRDYRKGVLHIPEE